MKSLIINRDKYIKVKSGSNGILLKTIIVVFSLVGIISILSSSLYATNKNKDEALDQGDETGQTSYNGAKNDESGAEQYSIMGEKEDETNNSSYVPEIIHGSFPEEYLVTKIVDGDTIYVSGIKTRIRLIGINTPEIHNGPVQCYGPEASNYLEQLILGKYVGLESDAASGDLDIYDRPLRYIYYNGENVNQKILLEGYGKEASYGSDYKYRAEFVESERNAISDNKGLWSPATCNGLE